ncbi:MAG: cellulase family glycosylhydrolase [Moorea sp. SIO2B7]|nr:cellulase family glycosylhydrolase [Moorena sp. SIO2B7]
MSHFNQNNIKVILDFHAAPGCQNGWDNGGREGVFEWHKNPEYIAQSLDFIERLSEQYQAYDNLYAIQLLNEPNWDLPLEFLKDYYIQAYARIINYLAKETTAVVIHDSLRPKEWDNLMKEPDVSNLIIDTHMYQCFTDEEENLDIYDQIKKAAINRKNEVDAIHNQLWTIVGEWSLGLPEKAFSEQDKFTHSIVVQLKDETKIE